MLMKTFTYLILFTFLLFSGVIKGQTCNTVLFSSPGAPATCTYTFSGGSWDTTPPSGIDAGESVCILDNNATDFGIFKGDLYIAAGVTYSGTIGSINSSSTIVVAGTASFGGEPPTAATIYIEETGIYNAIDTSYSPTGIIYNAGTFNASNDLALGGSALVYNYENATFRALGDASISKPFSNCGLFEVQGDLNTTGDGGLINLCSVWIHGDLTLNSDYTSNSLMILEGTLDFNGADFYNNDVLYFNNIFLNNNHLYGNGATSVLIVQNDATMLAGSSITGHYYHDMDDGGGFDLVGPNCIEDIIILPAVEIPTAANDLTANCGGDINYQ